MEIQINRITLFGLLFLSGSALCAEDSEQAKRLLLRGLEPSKVAYEGTMTVTHWAGTSTRSEEVRIQFQPPHFFRREFLLPNGDVARIVISNDQQEEIKLVRHNKTLTGGAVKRVPKQMPPEKEWTLLQQNYQIRLVGAEKVAGRPAWLIELKPLVDGKLTQRLWLDKSTGVILENKRFRPQNDFAILSRYIEFNTVVKLDPSLFALHSPGTVEDHEFAPDFLTSEDLKSTTGRSTHLPQALPCGFSFESADFFSVEGKPVDHFRYTDGLSVISVFQTARPVRWEKETRITGENGSIIHIKAHGENYTAVGEVPQELLQTIVAPIK